MKRTPVITHALACLMIVLAALGAMCGAVVTLAMDVDFYSGMSRQAVTEMLGAADAPDAAHQAAVYIGLDDEQQHAFAEEIVRFMRGETDAQPDILSEKEQQHMRDVRGLILLAQKASQALMTISAILAVIAAWTGARERRRGLPLGTIAGLLIVAAAAGGVYLLIHASGFERLFVGMHEMLFTNDLWLLDPRTDVLIRMMPQLLFERAGMETARLALRSAAITWVMLCMVYFIVGNMIRRNLTEREKQ